MEILNVKERKLNKDLIGYLINGQIFVPIGSESQELKEWLKTNTPEPEFTEEELKIKEINSQIQEAKQYLTETGWIWEKYNRNVLVLKDTTSDEFNLKYADIISKQEEYRALINELEVQLGGN